MKRTMILCLILLAVFVNPLPGMAARQASSSPLIIRSDDALYTWQAPGGSVERLKLPGTNLGVLALSPDNQWLAYEAVPSVISASIGSHGQPGDIAPFDLHLFNLARQQDVLVYKQPLTVQQLSDGGPFITLAALQWSPDGKQLAWLSFPVFDPSPNPVIALKANLYDLSTRKTATFDTALQPGDWSGRPVAAWTGSVLAVGVLPTSVARFSPDGADLGRTDTGAPITALIPVSQNGKSYIGALDNTNALSLIDPATGAVQAPEGGVERYSLSAPESGVSVFAKQRPDTVRKWQVVQPGGKITPLNLEPLAISPAGDQIAAITGNTVYIWQNGQVTPIGNTGGQGIKATDVLWSGMGWRVQPAAVNGTASMSSATMSKMQDNPVLIGIRGSLYAWKKFDQAPRLVPSVPDVSGAMVSPDGRHAVYRAQARVFGGQAFASYRQLWLLDLANLNSTLIGSVPDPGQDILRLSPSWSPDGSQIAWVELTWPGRDHRVVVYDVESQTAKVVIAGLPYPTDIFKTWMRWGNPGIAVVWTGATGSEARLYSPAGKQITRTPLGPNIYIDYPMWIKANGQDFIGVLSLENPDGLQLIDPANGLRRLTQGEIELYSPPPSSVPRSSISVYFANSPADSLDNWRVALPDSTTDPIHVIGGWDAVPSISPGGMEVAYAIYGRAFIYRDGEVYALPPTGKEEAGNTPAVSWGPVYYRLRQPTPAAP